MTYKAVGIIRGPINAEDLTPIPKTPWIVASGMLGPTVHFGRLYILDTRDQSCTELFPYNVSVAIDESIYGSGGKALEPTTLQPHGLDVGPGPDGEPMLYVVNHGGKESVEIFRINVLGPYPSLTWVGSLTLPHGLWGNDVVHIPGGGFLVSSTFDVSEGLAAGLAGMRAGEPTGAVAEWSPSTGWKILPGSNLNSANGIAVSSDGRWVYLAGTISKCIRKFSRGYDTVEIHETQIDSMIDNVTWLADRRHLLTTGATVGTIEEFTTALGTSDPRVRLGGRIWRVNAETLEAEQVAAYGPDEFGLATTALEVGDEIWLGSARFDGIARFRKA